LVVTNKFAHNCEESGFKMLRFLFFVYILLLSLFEPCVLPRELHCKFVRQMRNRDSAMKSRERKRTYVKELETKSKFLEAECHHLNYALQCYAAENVVLRQSLLKDRPVGAPTAMQESAVLTGKAHRANYAHALFCS
jgi:hypothetical protein